MRIRRKSPSDSVIVIIIIAITAADAAEGGHSGVMMMEHSARPLRNVILLNGRHVCENGTQQKRHPRPPDAHDKHAETNRNIKNTWPPIGPGCHNTVAVLSRSLSLSILARALRALSSYAMLSAAGIPAETLGEPEKHTHTIPTKSSVPATQPPIAPHLILTISIFFFSFESGSASFRVCRCQKGKTTAYRSHPYPSITWHSFLVFSTLFYPRFHLSH